MHRGCVLFGGRALCCAGALLAQVARADKARPDLRSVRVAVLYENVTDWPAFGRSLQDVIRALRETHAQFIFRGFWRWAPCPNRYEDLPAPLRDLYRQHGYSYENLRRAIAEIKRQLPGIIFCGAIPVQVLSAKIVWNPVTGKLYRYPQTWAMALDPANLGLPVSKRFFQYWLARHHLWVPEGSSPEDFDPAQAKAYFPDITDARVQELIVSWARKQIECGADAIWIDALYWLPRTIARTMHQPDHPAVKRTWQAAAQIIRGIRAAAKQVGRDVLVGTWGYSFVDLDAPPPKLDFVTFTPSAREVAAMRLDEGKWREYMVRIRARMGDVPVFAFIDWAATTRTPLGQFSQKLTPEQQCEFIKLADSFFTKLGIVFVYPVHGGYMGADATKLSFGKSRFYDSQAPEFATYATVRALADAKIRARR